MNERHAMSFGQAASEYQRGRPTYPAQAVEWMLAGCRSVADVGAGTGKLTAVIAASGREVVAVDPDPDMLAELSRALPAIPTAVGRAERLPLPDASRDAVTLGQAWHWVDPQLACPEIARVLAPGGTLGLIWNQRDEATDWVAQLGELLRRYGGADRWGTWQLPLAAPFGEPEERLWHWHQALDLAGMVDLVASRSHAIVLDEASRAQLLSDVRALLHEPGIMGPDGVIQLPYVTQAFRVRPTVE